MRLSVDEAFQKYADRTFSAAFSICQNRTDADDAVQDTFIKYYSLDMDYESEEHIRAWLIRVAVNRAKDIAGSFWHRNKVAWEDYMDELPFETVKDRGLFEAVMRLPDQYRVVIHLFYYEEYSVSEIAEILKRREGTVKSQLSRGRVLLKDMLKEEWDNDE